MSVQNAHCYFINPEINSSVPVAIKDGEDQISLLIIAKENKLSQQHPRQLKEELSTKITNPQLLDNLVLSRQGKLILTTKDIKTANEILKIESLLGVATNSFIQLETITSRFLLRIDPSVSCSDIAAELLDQGEHVHEIRRFEKKTGEGSLPTPSVLVTVYGTSLPEYVKLWYQIYRIKPFYDKPRSCTKCFKYNHATRSCRSEQLCKRCATSHSGECTVQTPSCANCNGPHLADHDQCPIYQAEVRLQQFRADNHLTIQEARRQFNVKARRLDSDYATVAATRVPSDSIRKADLDAALLNLSTQFTNLVHTLTQEIQQTMQKFMDSITQPLLALVQELQQKKTSKTNVLALQQALASSTKRPRLTDLLKLQDNPSLDSQMRMEEDPPTGHSSKVPVSS